MNKRFKILTIDGGGIRGVFAAEYLAKFEQELKNEGNSKWQIYQNFDLISGTSTGGIIAIALALGIPAKEIANLYKSNVKRIFRKVWYRRLGLFKSKYSNLTLQKLIRDKFAEKFEDDPRINDCKVPVCIPIYDLHEGVPSFLKTKHHSSLISNYHIPAYMAAMATSAAPTFFKPYSSSFIDLNGNTVLFRNKVDGGVFCNNPTLVAIFEAQKYFNKRFEDLDVISIGTGSQHFCDSHSRKKFGIYYWINPWKKRLIDLFLQGQSQQVQNLTKFILYPGHNYIRVNTNLDKDCEIDLDETSQEKISILIEKAHREFQVNGRSVIELVNKYE